MRDLTFNMMFVMNFLPSHSLVVLSLVMNIQFYVVMDTCGFYVAFLGSSKHWIDNIGHSSRLSLMFFFNSWFAISLLGLVSESSNRTPINYFLWPKLAVLIQLLLSVRPCLKLPFLTTFSIFPVALLLTTYIAFIPFVSVLKVQRIILDPLQDISCSYLY